MPETENKKSRRPLKNLPPDRWQPKMLLFWFALVGAVLALLWASPPMTGSPEILTIQDVVERAEAGNIQASKKSGEIPTIQPDVAGGRDRFDIRGYSRKTATDPY